MVITWASTVVDEGSVDNGALDVVVVGVIVVVVERSTAGDSPTGKVVGVVLPPQAESATITATAATDHRGWQILCADEAMPKTFLECVVPSP